jgi:hypothetical protein
MGKRSIRRRIEQVYEPTAFAANTRRAARGGVGG